MRIIIVGGSLSGLACALALDRIGHEVVVVEREKALGAGGSGLGVDRRLLSNTVGISAFGTEQAPPLAVITTNRDSTAWSTIYEWLRQRLNATSVALTHGEVNQIVQTPYGASIQFGAEELLADAVIGADGYRSVVRRTVNPLKPDARFAGYMLWRGLVDEDGSPEIASLPLGVPPVGVNWAGEYRLVAYFVPGADGSVQVGRRRISWAWYDPNRGPLLQATGCVAGEMVQHSLTFDQIPTDTRAFLLEKAKLLWPEPWRTAILRSISYGNCFGTPIAEYLPDSLANGRAAIIGDAAHVSSPMTGGGFRYALDDIVALSAVFADARSSSVTTALSAFEEMRLAPSRELASYSQRWSREYLAGLQHSR
jgi:2-polyprenyl-6-methoxyphenol hydroxylase-like FAD-dependent oxidoreductase